MSFNNKWLNYLIASHIAIGIPYFAHMYVPEKDTFKFKDLAEKKQHFLPRTNMISLARLTGHRIQLFLFLG